jgi:hypothetical protein
MQKIIFAVRMLLAMVWFFWPVREFASAQTFSSDVPHLADDWFYSSEGPLYCGGNLRPIACAAWGNKEWVAWNQIGKNKRSILIQDMYAERQSNPLTAPQHLQAKPLKWTPAEVAAFAALPDWFRARVEFAYWKIYQRFGWSLWQSSGLDCNRAKSISADELETTKIDPTATGSASTDSLASTQPTPSQTPHPTPTNREASDLAGSYGRIHGGENGNRNIKQLERIMNDMDKQDRGGNVGNRGGDGTRGDRPSPSPAPSSHPDHDVIH